MTTEDDFQKQLDEHPQDYQTRLVFADWLQDRDDPRAEGYRALGMLRKWPKKYGNGTELFYYGRTGNPKDGTTGEDWKRLPDQWLLLLAIKDTPTTWAARDDWRAFKTRRRIEDAAALAFTKLPVEVRAEILSAPITEPEPVQKAAPRKKRKPRKPRAKKENGTA